MKKMLIRLCMASACLLACYGAAFAAEVETLTYGGLQTLLAENKGKVVAVNFFASWCPPCRLEAPGLINIRKSYGADKLVLIGASLDEDDEALRKYMDEAKFNYPIKKSGEDLSRAAGVRGIPHMLIFDAGGELAANQSGYIPEQDLRAFLEEKMGMTGGGK
ncbi:MAG: TlpA family protein disulfide reductase [Deltaproteobacteria bacterium]|jgi:thiol-disulfide isomerase/thioredoxin|nr:TlpA family protein disulfide reductase [Deltaproteobacteria bacterium]